MSVLKLLLVAGARPNFMKIAPVIRAIQERDEEFSHVLVHTGQHYDQGMSDVFFRDLGIPIPDHHLNVGSGSHAQQTAKIMIGFEPILEKENPDCVLVFGDVNSTIGCSIVAKKLGHKVAHVEAGLRSGDRTMPEEINRIVTDAISDFFFATEVSGVQHLLAEGKSEDDVFFVGHVMIDNLYYEVARLEADAGSAQNGAPHERVAGHYGVVTLHRPSNVDDPRVLRDIVTALEEIGRTLPLVFPVHPRTRKNLRQFGIHVSNNITLTEPLGYREFLDLWRESKLVLTDSGGLQEETTGLGIPCLTLRENTERPVTVAEGTNRLVGNDPQSIIREAKRILDGEAQSTQQSRPKHWDGRASSRILDVLAKVLR